MTESEKPNANTGGIPISVLILTKDEQANIAECIRGLGFSDDIVVLDSYSTDKTVEIAESLPNVRVFKREFDTEYKQRNYGLHDIQYKHDWVYICDADERVPDDLVQEMAKKTRDADDTQAAYRVSYKNMYMGKWLKHATNYPVWIIRLVRPQKVTYEVRQTNVHPIVDGEVGQLECHFIHYSFNNGLRRWFEKHNFYSTREAIEGIAVCESGKPGWRELRNSDPIARRRAYKNLAFSLRGRWLWRFLYQYLFRFGWLDGAAGFHYCTMVSMYEYWIELKMVEKRGDWFARIDRLAEAGLREKDS